MPGILAMQAMMTAFGESTYAVMGYIKWNQMYAAMLATPLRVVEVLGGHLAVVAFHFLTGAAIFVVVAAPFGAFSSWWVVLAVPVAVLTGLAFAVPTFALSARLENDNGFSILFRFVVTPLMLFSGTFFPIDQLPVWMQPLAWVTPLWHGVELSRDAATGTAPGWLGAGAPRGAPRLHRRRLGAGARLVHPQAGLVSAVQTATRASRALPFPVGIGLARYVVQRNMTAFRRAWLLLLSGFVEPVFYLFSIGVGLGALVGNVTTDGGSSVPYAVFVAPALLASSAMNGAIADSTYNVFFKLKYQRLYDAMLATPLGPRDVAVGEITWSLMRGSLYSTMFLVVAVAAGLVQSWWALLAVPAAVLIGLAFGAIGMFATTYMTSLAALRLHQPRHPADVPVLRHLLPAVDLPRGAAVGGAPDPALQRGGARARPDARRGGLVAARQRRLPRRARRHRRGRCLAADRAAAAHLRRATTVTLDRGSTRSRGATDTGAMSSRGQGEWALDPGLPGYVTDGGLETDLVFHHGVELRDFAAFPLLVDPKGRDLLADYYAAYAAIAAAAGAGLFLETPTWRASADWGARLGVGADGLAEANADAVHFVAALGEQFASEVPAVVVAGQVGPRGDGYVADASMDAWEARDYHRPQVRVFAEEGVDVVTSLTLTTVAEAVGIVLAAREARLPVSVGFTVETDGRLPDGTPLRDAVAAVDDVAPPDWFVVNCAHPSHVAGGLADAGSWVERIGGTRVNASALSHAELDASGELDEGDPVALAAEQAALAGALPGLRVVGGCCGTDARHVAAMWGVTPRG